MSSNRLRRITKELADIQNDVESNIHAQAADGHDLSHLQASFMGPPETPYEGGTYIVDIKIPNEYPFRPPQMKFKTRLWHPNVSSQTGAICLDTLGTAWSPVLTIKSALLSLQSLLTTPEPKDPQDAEVAMMMINQPERYQQVAREWAIKHANAPESTQWHLKNIRNFTVSEPKQGLFSREENARQQMLSYQGYNKNLIDRFVNMGFDIERVVEAFLFVNIDRNNGEDYDLDEAYMGDITARLLGEP
ncbi:Ubiquitin-conjugating enzyme E2 1 [Golovinomyces cichoracearum]|uniref:Ubiquitin-conjugating enzyme E2 1 n=1 Tax=Golovinomyces cichoracearum TaxID=62708 RepID=A0A420HNW6_9PEZI|nr:Ubiquitin-conjugating enzyme E2 1 [Golovinomyces cichoracearum]